MAERYGAELAEALPEVDLVAGFGVPITIGRQAEPQDRSRVTRSAPVPMLDLLNLPRPRSTAPWAYVKIAEGCDRIVRVLRDPELPRAAAQPRRRVDPRRGRPARRPARSCSSPRTSPSYGKDRPDELGAGSIVPLVQAVAAAGRSGPPAVPLPERPVRRPRSTSSATAGVPYFDLSLQHVSKPLLRRMRRWGDGDRFLRRIADIRDREPDAAFRSNFIVGYPGETEADHDQLLEFVEEAQLDWCGFFAYSAEDGTYAVGLDGAVDAGADERSARRAARVAGRRSPRRSATR